MRTLNCGQYIFKAQNCKITPASVVELMLHMVCFLKKTQRNLQILFSTRHSKYASIRLTSATHCYIRKLTFFCWRIVFSQNCIVPAPINQPETTVEVNALASVTLFLSGSFFFRNRTATSART